MRNATSRDRADGNTTLQRQASLRASLLDHLKSRAPVVLQTHGGLGQLYDLVYAEIPRGVVFETDPEAAERLAVQRPTWRTYETAAADALAAGVAADLRVDFLDVGPPDGDPWPAVEAFFQSERIFPKRLAVAVTDGLRRKLKLGAGWRIATLKCAVEVFSNTALYGRYLEIARWNLERLAQPRDYRISEWAGFYAGRGEQLTHFGALLERPRASAPARAA